MNRTLAIVLLAVFLPQSGMAAAQADRMGWWREARFGMFIHWGAYAQLHGWWNGKAVDGLGEWIMHDAAISKTDYETTAAAPFNPAQFSAREWVALAKKAGQKYLVVTVKHHDGFSMWDTKTAGFDPYDCKDFTAWKQDPIEQICAECKAQGVRFCVYYSIADWHHAALGGYGDTAYDKALYVAGVKAQLQEIVTRFDPAVVWFPGVSGPWWTADDGRELQAYLRGLKDGVIVNADIGRNGFTEGDFRADFNADASPADYDREKSESINGTWGYKDADTSWDASGALIRRLVGCASNGANYLLSVGPDQNGVIPQAPADRLSAMGAWLAKNGESIYGSGASIFPQPFSWGRVTVKPGRVYIHVFSWPGGNHQISIPRIKNDVGKVFLLADSTQSCPFAIQGSSITITLPALAPDPNVSVIAMAVNGEPRTSDTLLLNNTSSSIGYGPVDNWSYAAPGRGLGDYRDDVHFASAAGDWFECSFSGIGVDYITEKNSDMGQVDLFIDSVFVKTIDCSNSSRLSQQTVFHQDLAPGAHTIKGVKKSGQFMLLDGLRIYREPLGSPVVFDLKPKAVAPEISIGKKCFSRTFDRAVLFTLSSGGRSKMRVRIMGINGTTAAEVFGANQSALSWNMTDGSGRPLAAGVYAWCATAALQGRTVSKSGIIQIIR